MEEMILQFITTYGWKLALIACSGIIILDILKFFNIFNKIPKDKRKYVFAGIASGLSILASGLYLWFTHAFTWASFGVVSGAIYALNQTIYSVYENYGLRALKEKIGKAFIHFIAGKEIEQAKLEIIDDINSKNEQ